MNPIEEAAFSARMKAFLAAIRIVPSVTIAARVAKVSRSAHYRALERDPVYHQAFDEAYRIGVEALEDEVVRRAQRGVKRLKFYHGSPVTMRKDPNDPASPLVYVYETEYSDSMALALLKAKKPAEYKDRVEHDVAPNAKKFEGTMEELLMLYRNLTTEEADDDA